MFNNCLIISIIITTLSLIVYFISILSSKTYETIDKAYIYSTSIIYLMINNYFVYIMHNNPFESKNYLIYSIIISLIYIVINFILRTIIKNNRKFDKDIKDKNDFIKEVSILLQEYEFDELREISDMIKYSDPVSNDKVNEIEKNIKEEVKNINSDNLKEQISKIKKLIKKRNEIIKNNK